MESIAIFLLIFPVKGDVRLWCNLAFVTQLDSCRSPQESALCGEVKSVTVRVFMLSAPSLKVHICALMQDFDMCTYTVKFRIIHSHTFIALGCH